MTKLPERKEINLGSCLSFEVPRGLNNMDELLAVAHVLEQLLAKVSDIDMPIQVRLYVTQKLSDDVIGMKRKHHAYRGIVGDWTKEEAREFLLKAGFITSDGTLHENYGGEDGSAT